MTRKIRIVHVINSFQSGGAEAMLCNLLLKTDRQRFDPFVVSLIDEMTVAGPVRDAGIPIFTANMFAGVPDPRGLMRLASHLRRLRPDVVQTWMDHSNLIGALAGRMTPHAKVVWGIHHSDHVRGVAKKMTLMTVRVCSILSAHIPAAVVFCSEHARKLYEAGGFDSDKAIVIPNGFDTSRFHPDADARRAIRAEIGVDPDAPLVGLIARYDPCKDHANFIRAAAALLKHRSDVRFLMCGRDVDQNNQAIVSQLESLGISGQFRLLGMRRDVDRVYAALDLNVSSSISEAFPLALGEAMACGVPCVATDVGDSRLIIGETGEIVPPRDSNALASAIQRLLSLSNSARRLRGENARARVRDLFDLSTVTRRYESLYIRLLDRSSDANTPALSLRQRMGMAMPVKGLSVG